MQTIGGNTFFKQQTASTPTNDVEEEGVLISQLVLGVALECKHEVDVYVKINVKSIFKEQNQEWRQICRVSILKSIAVSKDQDASLSPFSFNRDEAASV